MNVTHHCRSADQEPPINQIWHLNLPLLTRQICCSLFSRWKSFGVRPQPPVLNSAGAAARTVNARVRARRVIVVVSVGRNQRATAQGREGLTVSYSQPTRFTYSQWGHALRNSVIDTTAPTSVCTFYFYHLIHRTAKHNTVPLWKDNYSLCRSLLILALVRHNQKTFGTHKHMNEQADTHTHSLNTTQQMNPASSDVPIPVFDPFHPSACHLLWRPLQTVALFRSELSCGVSLRGTKRELWPVLQPSST